MPTDVALKKLIKDLQTSGFEGDIESSYTERVIAATDNSIYQLIPLAIFYPRVTEDINRAMLCIYRHRSEGFSLCARGAATGTNGQSLSDNLVLDCSRHLNQIIEFDEQQSTVTVQPGVVLDQLNAFLQPEGLFFPIDISTSSRATLGGMVATDASGKGSIIYGKTSDHIESLRVVLADGSSTLLNTISLEQMDLEEPVNADILLPCLNDISQHKDEIDRVFPVMNRGLTGYNLQQALTDSGQLNPCYLIAGSEGTLAITAEIKLRVIPRPTHRILTVIFYSNFLHGLEHVQSLQQSKPAAIEILDDKILFLAQQDNLWTEVQSVLADLPPGSIIKAANFIEHVGMGEADILSQQKSIADIIEQTQDRYLVVISKTVTDPDTMASLCNLRKRAVGLIGQSQNNKRGVPFVEDCAVPPQNLPRFITGFRELLDEYHLDYGMYGHADAGVLHVRPALDLLQHNDRKLIRQITDRVATLVKQHDGVLWGEHGRGFRGEYTASFFGDALYPVLCSIKGYFDPFNLLNPGKLVTPDPDTAVISVDEIMLLGEMDEQINTGYRSDYKSSLDCNGNGACHNWQPEEAMCPSYKATRNKLYSPKGRASLLREWVRLKSLNTSSETFQQLEANLYKSLQHCLSCKSCSTSCPLKVDIPELKSRFLECWHEAHPSFMSSLLLRNFETMISLGQRFPSLSNRLISNPLMAYLIKYTVGLHHLPKFSANTSFSKFAQPIQKLKAQHADSSAVILLRDNYMQSFDRQTLLDCCHLLTFFGYKVYVSDIIANAKPLHVKGYRKAFRKQAAHVLQQLHKLQQTGLPLLGSETVMRLMIDNEYADILQHDVKIHIQSIEAFLWPALKQAETLPVISNTKPVYLFPHCMEQTADRQSAQAWKAIFDKLGIKLHINNAGCCGMSGMFGHEVDNAQLSEDIFNLCWKPGLDSLKQANSDRILASGFSCRCQCHNHNITVQHPATYLVSILKKA